MCDPVTLAVGGLSAAASVVGGGMQAAEAAKNNRRIAEARNKVLRETNAKNEILVKKNRDAFNKRIVESDKPKQAQDLQNMQADRGAAIAQNIAPTATETPIAGNAPEVVKSNLAKVFADAAERSKAKAAALGNLQGYGDVSRANTLGDSELGLGVNTNNNFAGGNMAILPYLQDFAEFRATKPSSGLGAIIAGLGGLGSQFVGSRAGPY